MKYIIIDGVFPVIFHESMNHVDVAEGICGGIDKVSSAGFCFWDDKRERMVPYGESLSMKMVPGDLDEYLLTLCVSGPEGNGGQ